MDDGSYSYVITAPYGAVESKDFRPYFTPAEMLELGVFEGKYLNDCTDEFPEEWYKNARISKNGADIKCNHFQIKSRMSLPEWRERGWLVGPDNRGWFQWYCRYYLGRRIPDVDAHQIARWRSFRRHYGQVVKNCPTLDCRPRQRQALLQWSYNAFVVTGQE